MGYAAATGITPQPLVSFTITYGLSSNMSK